MNALTNCCSFPFFADGICPNCNQKCSPVPILEPAWAEDKSKTYYSDTIPEPIKPLPEYIEPKRTERFKDDERFEQAKDLEFQNNLNK